MSTPPTFFRVFTIESCGRMKIPSAFIHKSLNGQTLPEIVSLKDRYGNLWQVKVSKVNEVLYFTNGWSKLVSDNSIISGDFLVFEYSSENLFTFKLMGQSGLEKRGLGSFIQNIPQENHNITQDHSSSDNDDGPSGFERMDEDTFRHIRARARENIMQEDQNVDNNSSDHQSMDIEVDEDDAGDTRPRPRVDYNRRCYGMEIFNAGLAPQPRNPYFVVKMTQKRKADLFIPLKVIEDHNLDLDQHMTFVDPNGIRYLAKYKRWQDGRVMIGGGWRSLWRANHVEEGETCICEFIQRQDKNLDLNISFVRQ